MTQSTNPSTSDSIPANGRIIRIAVALIVVGLSCVNIRYALNIGRFRAIFKDFSAEPLPALTVFVNQFHLPLVLLSLILPACAIAAIFMRSLAKSFYVLGALGVLTFAEGMLLHQALVAPIETLITR